VSGEKAVNRQELGASWARGGGFFVVRDGRPKKRGKISKETSWRLEILWGVIKSKEKKKRGVSKSDTQGKEGHIETTTESVSHRNAECRLSIVTGFDG